MGGKPIDVSEQWLYERRAMTASEMAREYGCSANGMTLVLRRHPDIPRWRDLRTGALCIPLDWLREQARTRTLYSIADELHVKTRTLRDYANANGIKLKLGRSAYHSATCPCEHEAECRARGEWGPMLCEVEQEVAA